MNAIVTRFAPSPTGNLHIGSVRTALINYVISKQAKKKDPDSKFLLRIEDTDKTRSNNEYKENILKGLKWLGISYDEEPYIQSLHIKRHQEIAKELIKNKRAFKCICTKEILESERTKIRKNLSRNKKLCKSCETNEEIQSMNKNYTVRIKIPNEGITLIRDAIQGEIKVDHKEIDDFILLREDGTPTYMLSVVVDDFDMGVNFVIRGDDHINNMFRQYFIYKNMNWKTPKYAHLALIHGEDGKKLSKRHGAVDIHSFKDMGYLKESIINNLILLGWSAKEKEEFINLEKIIELFEIKNISKSSSIFNYNKLNFFNNYYIKNDGQYFELLNYCNNNNILFEYISLNKDKFLKLFNIYKEKVLFYKNLEDISKCYFQDNFISKKNNFLDNNFNFLIKEFFIILKNLENWEIIYIEEKIKKFIDDKNIKFVLFGKPMRLMLINEEKGPSISEILYILGKKSSMLRINNYITSL